MNVPLRVDLLAIAFGFAGLGILILIKQCKARACPSHRELFGTVATCLLAICWALAVGLTCYALKMALNP